MKPLNCDLCGQQVLVEKFSAVHTSIQWTNKTDNCPTIRAAGLGLGDPGRSCAALQNRIERAVLDSEILESTIELPSHADLPRLH
jgi:hypothetical protein